jgi:phage tail-like protein
MGELKIRPEVKVPDLVGKPLDKAKLMIENAGLRLDAVLFRESYEDPNLVLAQKPRAEMGHVGDFVTLWVARQSYTELLPAIYRRSDPTGRNFVRDLCWILQHLFGGIQERLDGIHNYFDPYECPEEFLSWLAGWTAMVVDIDWPIEKKRAIIKRAIELYGIRGTVKGLKLFLKLFTGYEPKVIENQWPFRGFRIETEGLIGIDSVILPPVHMARCFIVEMPVRFTNVSPEMVVRIHNIIQMEKPANTHYYLRFAVDAARDELRDFFHIGLRSGIGIEDEITQQAEEEHTEVIVHKAAQGGASGSDGDQPEGDDTTDKKAKKKKDKR